MLQGYDQKLTSLSILSEGRRSLYDCGQAVDVEGSFPILESLYCWGSLVIGTLNAPLLQHIRLELDPTCKNGCLDWSAFSPMQAVAVCLCFYNYAI